MSMQQLACDVHRTTTIGHESMACQFNDILAIVGNINIVPVYNAPTKLLLQLHCWLPPFITVKYIEDEMYLLLICRYRKQEKLDTPALDVGCQPRIDRAPI